MEKVSIHPLQVVLIQRQLADVIVTDCIADGFVSCRALVALFDLVQHFRTDTSLVLLRAYG